MMCRPSLVPQQSLSLPLPLSSPSVTQSTSPTTFVFFPHAFFGSPFTSSPLPPPALSFFLPSSLSLSLSLYLSPSLSLKVMPMAEEATREPILNGTHKQYAEIQDGEDNQMTGNGVVGILAETCNIWERRSPLTPSHCARLLLDRCGSVRRILVQPSPKRIHHDAKYAEVGCEISDDLSPCGLILGIKPPKTDKILPGRAYAFFSHTHKAQTENMPLLDKILAERATLYDYELIVGDDGKRVLAFGKFAGRAGLIDFLHGLGKRYLNLGYSTPFLSLGSSHMYSSLAAAKAAVITVGEEIATMGLPLDICPIVFVFTGIGNVSQGAQEIFKLLPHTFVDPHELQGLADEVRDQAQQGHLSKRVFQVYGCIVTCQDMVAPKDHQKRFNKGEYYAHPARYEPIFHEKIAPYASVIVNCMYWEKRFPRLLSNKQLRELASKSCPLVGISDITCDIGGSMEFINRTTSIEKPFFRYNAMTSSYHDDMVGEGVICLAVDILPTEFPREASKHFGDILSEFVGQLARTRSLMDLPPSLRRACISFNGKLTQLYEYIPRMRTPAVTSQSFINGKTERKNHTAVVSLSGHLFDQFLINEALDIIEAANGSFRLIKCEVGQNSDDVSYSELEVGANDSFTLDEIVDSLASIASRKSGKFQEEKDRGYLKEEKMSECAAENGEKLSRNHKVLILGAGRVCQPAAELLTSSGKMLRTWQEVDEGDFEDVHVTVASLFLKDAEEITDGIPNTRAVQLDVMDEVSLSKFISDVDVVISLLPSDFHLAVACKCIEHKKHLVTASYVDDSMSKLDEKARKTGITILCEMGLDPGIDHMMAMKMIDQAHERNGKVTKFASYCGGLPSPEYANNPLAYKFSWNPAGAIKAGRLSATYKCNGKTIQVNGNELYDSATRIRVPDLPAFALECFPNRNSLAYGDLYGIKNEASTIFRATLRYEGFSEIMGTLEKIGLFNSEAHSMLKESHRPTFLTFLSELLNCDNDGPLITNDEDMAERIVSFGYCEELAKAMKTVKTIRFLGLDKDEEIPLSCRSAFDVSVRRMEEKLTYSGMEKDMVLLHHEVEVHFPDKQQVQTHHATLLELGKIHEGKMTSAMALTVGIPAAIGALLLLKNKIKTTGVVRPLVPEVYIPALEILEACGLRLTEKVDILR